MPLDEAVIDAGAVRFRPMALTAAAVVVGSAVILFDPIFQGLAIALMAGEIASTLLSRIAVPVLYYHAQRRFVKGRWFSILHRSIAQDLTLDDHAPHPTDRIGQPHLIGTPQLLHGELRNLNFRHSLEQRCPVNPWKNHSPRARATSSLWKKVGSSLRSVASNHSIGFLKRNECPSDPGQKTRRLQQDCMLLGRSQFTIFDRAAHVPGTRASLS